MKKYFLLFIFLIFDVFGKVEKKFDLDEFENYFNKIKQVESEFTEKNGEKEYHGKIFLNRPKKEMKITYKDRPLEITVKNYNLKIYNSALKEVSEGSVYSYPLAFLVKNKVNLKKEVEVMELSEDNNFAKIKLCKKNSDENGAIVLKFSKNPLKLIGWKILEDKNYDFNDRITEFFLKNASIQLK